MADKEPVDEQAAKMEEEDDPLIIDEEKTAEKESVVEGDKAEEDEKEFEPTVDMIMNEFDDETTIDEEETMTQEDEAAELNALKDEQDMPIEELLKMYGYNKDAPKEDAVEAADTPVGQDSSKTDSEVEETVIEPEKTDAEILVEKESTSVLQVNDFTFEPTDWPSAGREERPRDAATGQEVSLRAGQVSNLVRTKVTLAQVL